MQTPPIPKDEDKRLDALWKLDLLDTPAEERFDRLTRIANKLFKVPIVLVSLVDRDRQWFKSSVGLSVDETPRDISVCGHTILGVDTLVVNDALLDERFRDNPLVQGGPRIRFYAGFPLRAPDGSKIGTICIMDREPRDFSSNDDEALKDLAAIAQREIELTELATVDELTSIPNRRGFRALAEKGLKLCQRKQLPASLVYFDIDEFKQINDSHGHAEGDRALSLFADTLKTISRDSDVFARLGGDEFVILLTDAGKETAESIIGRFRFGLDEFCKQKNLQYEIHFSYGIIESDSEAHTSVAELLRGGDELMYAQKRQSSKH